MRSDVEGASHWRIRSICWHTLKGPRTEAEEMQESPDQDDANAERAGERVASAMRGAVVDVDARTRRQAALVRESLVRCPGGSDLRAE